jgi:CheY-like chemotaxis protein
MARPKVMNVDDTVKVLDGLTKLLAVLLWPAIVAFFLIRFRAELAEFVTSLSELSFKGAGIEASLKRRQAEAAAALGAAAVARQAGAAAAPGAAEAARSDAGVALTDVSQETRAAAELVAEVVTPRVIRRAERSRVLWVDDRPANNAHERQALEALGVTFVLATSTEEALEKVRRQSFDAIISDMGRALDSQAGYTLLDKLREAGNRTPFIIYAGSGAAEHRAEARRRGAIGSTNRPDELFDMVLTALGKKSLTSR